MRKCVCCGEVELYHRKNLWLFPRSIFRTIVVVIINETTWCIFEGSVLYYLLFEQRGRPAAGGHFLIAIVPD